MAECRCGTTPSGARVWCEKHYPGLVEFDLSPGAVNYVGPAPFKGLAETYGAVEADGLCPECGEDPAQIERLRSAMDVAIKNLEACEVAQLGTIQHVIRSLKDALDG